MNRYTLAWCDQYLDELLDKVGSDYFPLPIKLDRFITATYDFLRDRTKSLEITQEVSDDLKPLLKTRKLSILKSEMSIYSKNTWNCPEPIDYYRLIGLVPVYVDVDLKEKIKSKKTQIIQAGQRESYARDPYREPTAEYPNIIREANLFSIDVGEDSTTYTSAIITYVKKPLFAKEDEETKRIVDLNDSAIDQILLKTSDYLRFGVSDENAANNYQFNSQFGEYNK